MVLIMFSHGKLAIGSASGCRGSQPRRISSGSSSRCCWRSVASSTEHFARSRPRNGAGEPERLDMARNRWQHLVEILMGRSWEIPQRFFYDNRYSGKIWKNVKLVFFFENSTVFWKGLQFGKLRFFSCVNRASQCSSSPSCPSESMHAFQKCVQFLLFK